MSRIITSFLFATVLGTSWGIQAQAQIINATTCSSADVQAAFNRVTASTTTVNIPSCPSGVAWTSQVTLTVPSGSSALSILGAGSLTTTGGGDQTVIIDNYNSGNALLMIITAGAPSNFRLAGITVNGGTGGGSGNPKYGVVKVAGQSQNVRVDHNHFNNSTYSPGESGAFLVFQGWIYGVTDHNVLDLGGNVGDPNGIWIWHDGYNGDSAGYGDNSWVAPTNLGSSQFMFIEDNVVNNGALNDCTHGGRFVVRHNTMNSTSIQTHPTGGSGRARGCRAWEFYDNSMNASNSSPQFNGFFLSSGTGVIWGNSAPTGYESFLSIHSILVDTLDYHQSPTPNGWGYCGTSSGLPGDGSAWNGNLTSGYPCLDQPGQGQSDQLQGQFPQACDVTSGQCALGNYNGSWPNERLEPVYEWSDTWAPVPGYGTSFINNYESTVLAANRDYYLWCNPSSPAGCTSNFNGTSGTGSGPLSARPSTCTSKVAYWATDTNTLYQCSASNTWTPYYTPYTYPHPLVQGGGDPPPPPTNLQATPQ